MARKRFDHEPQRGYTVKEQAQLAALIAAAAARGKPTGAIDRAIDRVQAAACERERLEDEAAAAREKARRAEKVKKRAERRIW